MIDYEKTTVPLDDAHKVLAAFGIGPDNREYQRWKRDDGFRLVDFEGVLSSSPLVLGVNWREWLQDAVDTITVQLNSIGIVAVADLGEDGDRGTLEIDGNTERVKYVPNDEDDFDDTIGSINRLIANRACYRKFRSCEGSDGWCYGLLTNHQWGELQNTLPGMVDILFFPAD